MIKILVISDSHGNNNMIKNLIVDEKPQIVLHAGDYCCNLEQINSFVDYIVDGNNDWGGKDFIKIKVEDIYIGITHGHKLTSFSETKTIKNLLNFSKKSEVNLLIFGHTHKEFLLNQNNITILNPGSINYPRNKSLMSSYAIVNVDGSSIDCKIKYINKRHQWF